MGSSQEQGSEVARLLKQIRDEYASAKLGITGLACGTSQHHVITQKMENIEGMRKQLTDLVGSNDAAMSFIVQQMDTLPSNPA